MIFHNHYSGTFHEVPGPPSGDPGNVVFDGFGNPVGGWFDDIGKAIGSIASVAAPIARSILPGPAGALIGAGANYLKGMMPGGPAPAPPRPPAPMPLAIAPPPATPMPMPGPAGMTAPSGMPGSVPPLWPTGWRTAPVPYTGLGPQRMYMRCAVWPGPSGLVPEHALNMPAAPGAPGPAAPPTTGPVFAPVMAPSFAVGHRPTLHTRRRR